MVLPGWRTWVVPSWLLYDGDAGRVTSDKCRAGWRQLGSRGQLRQRKEGESSTAGDSSGRWVSGSVLAVLVVLSVG